MDYAYIFAAGIILGFMIQTLYYRNVFKREDERRRVIEDLINKFNESNELV